MQLNFLKVTIRSGVKSNLREIMFRGLTLTELAKIYEILLEYISFPEMNLPSVDFEGYDMYLNVKVNPRFKR